MSPTISGSVLPAHTDTDTDRAVRFAGPGPDEIAAHIAEAHHLRAEAVRRMAASLRRLLRGARGGIAEEARDALASIRASAGILRDHPAIADEDRARFLGIVIEEGARLERLLPGLAGRA